MVRSGAGEMTGGVLVIGFGDSLRSDDGAGPRVAALLPPAETLVVRVCDQLTPEAAEDLRGRDLVVFVDATATLDPGAVAVRPLEPGKSDEASQFTHDCRPETLLLLAERLYDARPRAFLVTIGAASFDFGAALSPTVEAALPTAAEAVRRVIEGAFDQLRIASSSPPAASKSSMSSG